MTDLIRQCRKWKLSVVWEQAFKIGKPLLCNGPTLRDPDFALLFVLAANANRVGVWPVLLQEGEG